MNKKISIARVLKGCFIAITLIASASIIYLTIITIMSSDIPEEQLNETIANTEEITESEDSCNVMGIGIAGYIVTYIPNNHYDEKGGITEDETSSDQVMYSIGKAEKDSSVKAIIIEIDSPGGNPVAGEEMADAIKSSTKPTIAIIRGTGTSAAYLAATGAKIIYASKNSDVGGIGVTMSYLDYAKQNSKDGITYNQLSSGKFKDSGDPDKSLTAEEKQLFERDLNIIHSNFVEKISTNRKLSIDKVKKLADGSTMLGEMALKNGLIDKLGGPLEVRNYLNNVLKEEIEICWE